MYQGTYVVRRGPLYYKTLEFEKQKKRDELEKARNAQIAEAIRVARIKAARECNIDKSKIIPRSNYDYAIKSHFMMAVADAVCDVCQVPIEEIMSFNRKKAVLDARHLALFVMYKTSTYSYPHIGRFFGKDHATVIHAVSKGEKIIQTDLSFYLAYRSVLDRLSAVFNHDYSFWGS